MADESKSELSVSQQKLLNGVLYEMIPESTIATARTFKRQYFQKNSYSANNQAICDWNTGDAYINPRRSYLAITMDSTLQANFGVGGVTNLIRRIVISSRSGTEVSRTEDYNLLATKLIRYQCSKDYVTDMAQVMGYTNDPDEMKLAHDQLTTSKTYLIPLSLLSGFFAGDGKTLIPPQLAAGLRIELTLESDTRALVGAAPTTYGISAISFLLNTTQMVDSWQKQISAESARDGLSYSFSEWHTTQSTLQSSTTQINVEVRKAVARALLAFAMPSVDADDGTKDNMKSSAWTGTSKIEWRLGSLYPTQQPIQTVNESFFQAQNIFDAGILDCKRTNGISPTSFELSTAAASEGHVDGMGIYAVSLERNDVRLNGVLSLSGLPTNNSRSLALDVTYDAGGTTRKFHLFMKHLRIVKIFLDNVSVSE